MHGENRPTENENRKFLDFQGVFSYLQGVFFYLPHFLHRKTCFSPAFATPIQPKWTYMIPRICKIYQNRCKNRKIFRFKVLFFTSRVFFITSFMFFIIKRNWIFTSPLLNLLYAWDHIKPCWLNWGWQIWRKTRAILKIHTGGKKKHPGGKK